MLLCRACIFSLKVEASISNFAHFVLCVLEHGHEKFPLVLISSAY